MIRSPEPDDLRFVRSTWLESYATSDYARLLTPPPYWDELIEVDGKRRKRARGGRVYFESHRALIDQLIERSVVLVDAEADLLAGFAVGWPGALLHYVYVKQHRRGHGVARALLEALDLRPGERVTYTHRSLTIRGNPKGWIYDPSPTTLLKDSNMRIDTSKMHRVKYVQFDEHLRLRGGASGNVEMRKFIRTEEDKAVAYYDDRTATIYLFEKDIRGEDVVHVAHTSTCRDTILYPDGVGPSWEKKGEDAARKA